ncbi:glycoside hydrolase family 30 protein [Mucilaginibacter sp.]
MKNRKNHLPVFITTFAILTLTFFGCSKTPSNNNGGGGTNGSTGTTGTTTAPLKTDVNMWLTNPDQSQLLAKQNVSLLFTPTTNSNITIHVDTTTTYQTVDGFGFALTDGSAQVINGLNTPINTALIKELFSTDSACIGVSYLRLTIGASDLSTAPYTYDDVAAGSTDPNLTQFSLTPAMTDLIPTLKKILAINPNIKILACPWSAPAWMKTNGNLSGGSLLPQYYSAYANYFVKYIQAMAAQGVNITAITPQNEPLNAYNNPAMLEQDTAESVFIAQYLGPAFAANNITTKIICYDHNCDHPEYATYVLNSSANQYVDGSAFHFYAGPITALSQVHNAFPNKNIYFTEYYTGSSDSFSGDLSYHVGNLIIGAMQNWSRNVLEWNLASDPSFGPHTTNGCSTCMGALTISGGATVQRNVSYYIIAHASKFVRPGATRIASDVSSEVPNIAFKNTDGSKVLIVLNSSGSTQSFNISFNSKIVTSTLEAGAVATYTWH